MARAPFQVLIIPYTFDQNGMPEFAVFQRLPHSGNFWQWISGGGEDSEIPDETAKRESFEEAGISSEEFYRLHTLCSIQRNIFKGHELWDTHPYVIPEYAFAVHCSSKQIILSSEHQAFQWLKYDEAMKLLKWDSNKTALWELNQRLQLRLENDL